MSTPVGARCPSCAKVKRFATLLKPAELARAIGFGLLVQAGGTALLALVPLLGALGPLITFAVLGFAVGEVVSISANRKRVRELGPIAVACIFVGYEVGLLGLLVSSGLPKMLEAGVGRVGTVPEVGLRGDERPENYGVRLTGFLRVPADALYTFHLVSDDGAKLRIDDDLVVDHDGQHDATEKQGQIALRAGLHRMELVYFQGPGGAVLQLAVSAPGVARRPVPRDWFVHPDGGGR